MEQYVVKNQKKLALGYTTGSCAAAAAKAAACALLSGQPVRQVQLMTPKGISLLLDIEDMTRTADCVRCAVRKDAGDDPDITHGILVYAAVSCIPEGIVIDGGEGVGRVTRPGLAQPVGTAAINPAPRRQIAQAVQEASQQYGYTGGFFVEISIPEGEALGARTFNPELGIVGGLSVLGTSGIVEPMSEQALIDTIHLDIDTRYAAGERTLLLCPGNYGEDFARDTLGLDVSRGVKCSNFIGEALDYAVYSGFSGVLLVGHAGKLIKLAAGVFQTHSAYADARQEIFAAHAAMCGASAETVRTLMAAVTVDACLEILQQEKLDKPVLASISHKILQHMVHRTAGKSGRAFTVDYVIFTNRYGIMMQTENAASCIASYRHEEERI
ncbi:MAG: cobalt-precorrin-5B (C(1))-methyltransferase CbiD [Eubacteriales bacterium]|nr:cobalt-precorrin-5B (C(1))-methyltransferase CbiD [Eubacteriales bacterium]